MAGQRGAGVPRSPGRVSLRGEVEGDGEVSEKHYSQFWEACADDLNTPRALAALWGVLRDQEVSASDKYATLLSMDRILGLGVGEMREVEVELDEETQALVCGREEARKRKDFAEADRIRDELLAKGIILEDTPEGTKVRLKDREGGCA